MGATPLDPGSVRGSLRALLCLSPPTEDDEEDSPTALSSTSNWSNDLLNEFDNVLPSPVSGGGSESLADMGPLCTARQSLNEDY